MPEEQTVASDHMAMTTTAGNVQGGGGAPESVSAVTVREAGEMVVNFGNSTLTQAQAIALRALTEGASLNDAAAAARVERITLYRWRTRNSQFMAALNAWRREQLEFTRDQIVQLRDAAMNAVRQGLGKGDPRLGVAVLDRIARQMPATPPPTVPGMIESPEIQENDEEGIVKVLEKMVHAVPTELRGLIPGLLGDAMMIYNYWGREIMSELAQQFQSRLLTPDQAKRVKIILTTTFDAQAALAEAGVMPEGGVPSEAGVI